MITFVRTATIAPGKFGEATALLHEIAKLVETATGHHVNTSMQIGGNAGRIAQTTSHPNLAEFETAMTKLMGDAEYMRLVAGAAPLFMPGATHDELWQSV